MNAGLHALGEDVSEWLARLEIDADRSGEGVFLFKAGSTGALVSLFADDAHVFVRVAALVATGVTPKVELFVRLLRLNAEALVGAFQLFDDHTLAFTYTLRGDTLDFETFAWALDYVIRVGDDHDEELQALAGGRRVEDVLDAE